MKFYRVSNYSGKGLTKCRKPAQLLVLLCFPGLIANVAYAGAFQPNPNAAPGNVIVHGQFGGNIFGFEVDPNGTEGLLCESLGNADGTVLAAVGDL